MTYTLTFRATIPVEPFRLARSRFNTRTRLRESYVVQVDHLSILVYTTDGEDATLSTQARKIRKDGQPSERAEYEGVSWDELPEQAREALRDAYAQACSNIQPILNKER
jgi:hypothetical protein